MPEDQPSNNGSDWATNAEAADITPEATQSPSETRISRLKRSWSSIASVARQSHAVIAPLAHSAAKNLSASAKSAYDVATSEQAVALYRNAGHEAVRAASAGTKATVDASRKVRDTLTSDEAKVVYGQVGDAASVAASHGAQIAGSAASFAGKAMKHPVVRSVAALAVSAAVGEVATQLGLDDFMDQRLSDFAEGLVNRVGTADAGLSSDMASSADITGSGMADLS